VFDAIGQHGLPPSTIALAIATGEHDELGGLEPAYPGLARLRELRIESRAMDLGEIELPELRSLELVTRGLTRDNLASLQAASWPKLERLVLWLGDVGVHGCDIEPPDLAWIVAARGLPSVNELGLCGREVQPLLERLVDAPILLQLRVLDLAGGYLTTDTVAWLSDHAAAFAHLAELRLPFSRYDTTRKPSTIAPFIVDDDRFIPVYE